ncbi:hypothetical protein CEXT_409271 [Caerostris extrusa]|uniref:Uncharacterized protein n=1 Tax=Caerostris extrusa TaxID=172846 RepID=A0AAV4SEG0_CAEEX|nr:hypothetical protein CEXT_409271 [Caerostris extrusa]
MNHNLLYLNNPWLKCRTETPLQTFADIATLSSPWQLRVLGQLNGSPCTFYIRTACLKCFVFEVFKVAQSDIDSGSLVWIASLKKFEFS